MAVRNQNWYDLNESRPWPISDEASGVGDDGVRLASRALADLQISYPLSAARRAFIGAVAITPTLATVTILGADEVDSPASFVPLAAITLPKPFDAYRMYPLAALYPGVGGWIVFGREAARDDANIEQFHARFSTPAQSVLQPSCARAYRDLPVASFGKLGEATALTGLIRLSGGNDIEVVRECREVPLQPGTGCDPNLTQARDVVVVRLRETVLTAVDDIAPVPARGATAAGRNVFDIYRGPCAGSPESGSCPDPQPIELLASVPPDCCGNIDLVLRGCATPSKITSEALVIDDEVVAVSDACGVVIDCALSLAEACVTPDRLPDAAGRLPNEYDDLCESVSSISIDLTEESESMESFSVLDESESAAAQPELPFCDNFAATDPDLVVVNGYFSYVDDDRRTWSTEHASGQAMRNASLWDFEWSTFYRRVFARVQLLAGSSGSLHNAAVVVNYHETLLGSNLYSYYVAEIDYDGFYHGYKLFRIARFNGLRWFTEFAVPVPNLAIGELYDLSLTVYPVLGRPTAAWLLARLRGVDNPSIDITIGPLAKNGYVPEVGKFGMGTNRAATKFWHFCVENTADITNGPPIVEP